MTINVAERLEAHIISELNDDICWITDLAPDSDGYVFIMTDGDQVRRRAHRVAWEMHNAEPIPEGMLVLHSCDNPGCVNPNHLRVGTHRENMNDMTSRNRGGGGHGPQRKYDYKSIREAHANGMTAKEIQAALGCGLKTVYRALEEEAG